MAINEVIPPFTATPLRTNPATYSKDTDTYHLELAAFIASCENWRVQANQTQEEINTKATQVSSDTIEVANNATEVATNTAKALTYAERAESAVPVGDSYNMDTVDLKDSNVLNASLPNSGYTKVSKKLDNFVFKEDVNFTYKIADKNQYIKFGDVIVDTHTHASYNPTEKGVIADFANTVPKVAEIITEASGLTTIEIAKNEHIIIDKTNPSDYTLTTYKAIQDAPIGTSITDILYFKDVTDIGVKNQAIATQKNLTKEDDGITPLQNGYTGINAEILSSDFGKDKTIEEVLLDNGFTKTKPFLYSKDNFLHTPIERRQMNQNQYMYHPFLNPYGTKKASDGNFWYDTSISFLTVADCFNTNNLLTNSGDIASGVTGSPRNRFYNVMYKEDGADSRQYAKLANKIDIDLLKKDKLDNAVDEYFSSISSGSFFDVELLGNSTYYPQILKDRITSGVVTQVLLNTVDDNGNSNIPDGIKTSFKMNKKMIQNYEVLKSTDSGVTWSKLASGFTVDLIANTINFTVAPLATDIILISNEASNDPYVVCDPKPVVNVEPKVIASNTHSIYKEGKTASQITGKITVGDGLRGLESKTLENVNLLEVEPQYINSDESALFTYIKGNVYTITNQNNIAVDLILECLITTTYDTGTWNNSTIDDYGVKFNVDNTYYFKLLNSRILTTPEHNATVLDKEVSATAKWFNVLEEDDYGLHAGIYGQELVVTGGNYGDNDEFEQLSNGTLIDLNGNTIRTFHGSMSLNIRSK